MGCWHPCAILIGVKLISISVPSTRMTKLNFSQLIDKVLAFPKESEWLEFKHNNADPQQIGQYISALANSAVIHKQERAYLVWGVEDGSGTIAGTTFDPSRAKQGNQALEMWLSQKLRPTPHFEFICGDYSNKVPMVVLAIRPVKEQPVKFDNVAYVRVGSHKTNLDSQPGKLKEFWSQVVAGDAGMWDERKEESATLADLSDVAIEDFFARLTGSGRVDLPRAMDRVAALTKLGLLIDDKPTRAAVLLLTEDPRRFYPTAYIKAGRFKTATEILDDREFHGTLFQQIDSALMWFQERMTKRFIIGKSALSGRAKVSGSLAERTEEWQYPISALREAVANAICHRDYMIASPTNIRLYDDRLEIWNPGALPSNLSPESLLKDHPSHPPNRLIATCFYNTRIIERWGTGTLRMASELNERKQPPPIFDTSAPNVFKVIMFASGFSSDELIAMNLNERQVGAIRYLQLNRTITNATYQELFGASKATSSRDLSELVAKSLLVKVGTTGKGTSYSLAERAVAP